MRASIYLAIMTAAAGSQLGATDCGQVLRDPGFDLWCDGTLCAWKLERGQIAQVPTWTDGDSGVQLLGTDTAIEQVSPVTDADGTCLEFDVVANIDDDAEVDLNIDIDGDGTIDSTERLPTSHWQPLTYKLPIQAPFDGIRFELAKSGTGVAVLANIGAQTVTDCGGLAPIVPGPAPLGAACDVDANCASGMCRVPQTQAELGLGTVCVACDPTLGSAACAGSDAGDVCGIGDPVSPLDEQPQQCEPAATRELGERCGTDGECTTGICTIGTCSTCRSTAPSGCANSETCGPDWQTAYGVYAAWVCSPGGRVRTTGQPCASDGDCASGTCNGTPRAQCDDGRPCTTDATCPFAGDLQSGACTTVGIQGGSCQ